MLESYLIRGLLIGLIFGVPAGQSNPALDEAYEMGKECSP